MILPLVPSIISILTISSNSHDNQKETNAKYNLHCERVQESITTTILFTKKSPIPTWKFKRPVWYITQYPIQGLGSIPWTNAFGVKNIKNIIKVMKNATLSNASRKQKSWQNSIFIELWAKSVGSFNWNKHFARVQCDMYKERSVVINKAKSPSKIDLLPLLIYGHISSSSTNNVCYWTIFNNKWKFDIIIILWFWLRSTIHTRYLYQYMIYFIHTKYHCKHFSN